MQEDVVIGHDHPRRHSDMDKFSRGLAKSLNARYVNVELKTFPDNEVRPTLKIKSKGQIEGKNVLLVSRTNRYEPRPNDAIIELGLTVNNLVDMKAGSIDVVMPYMFYARQDKAFLKGEPASLSYIAKLYQTWTGDVDNLITMNSHLYGKPRDLGQVFSKLKIHKPKVHDLSCSGLFAEYFRKKELKDPVIITPGAKELAEELSEKMGIPYENLKKPRDRSTGEITMEAPKTDLEGKRVILLDDVSASGGTIMRAYGHVRRAGGIVTVALPHFMTWEGIGSVYELVKIGEMGKVVTTDSLDSYTSSGGFLDCFEELSTVPLFSDYIRKL